MASMTKSHPRPTTQTVDELQHLGHPTTDSPQTYSPQLLEAFTNTSPKGNAWTSFICNEFTSLCPKTRQPDFARLFINYIAHKKMLESKSLKLYLFSFRQHGAFHEECIQTICDDLLRLLRPKFIEVIGEFSVRGGIAIHPYVSWANKEETYQKLKEYRDFRYVPGKFSP